MKKFSLIVIFFLVILNNSCRKVTDEINDPFVGPFEGKIFCTYSYGAHYWTSDEPPKFGSILIDGDNKEVQINDYFKNSVRRMSWTPDGQRIIGPRASNNDIWADRIVSIDVETGIEKTLIHSPYTLTDGSVGYFKNGYLMPDNETLLLEGYQSIGTDLMMPGALFLYYIPSDSLTRILPPNGFSSPHWSPDGKKIVMVKSDQLYIANIDGSGCQLFFDLEGFFGDPRWSPDGKKIAYWHKANIWTIDANIDTSTIECVTCNADIGRADLPLWGKDSKTIAFLRSSNLYSIQTDGTELTEICNLGIGFHINDFCAWYQP